MRLHGHSFRVLSRNGTAVPHRQWADTVLVPPGLLINTEAMVAEVPKKQSPAMPGGPGGGMGGMDFCGTAADECRSFSQLWPVLMLNVGSLEVNPGRDRPQTKARRFADAG
jgi:hypothetical protein